MAISWVSQSEEPDRMKKTMIPITANIYFLLQDAHQENEHRLEIYRENKKFGSHIILLTKRKAPFSRTICTAKYIPVLWGGGYIRE